MSPSETKNGFDALADTAAFLGTWVYPRDLEAGGMACIHFTDDGRAIDSFVPVPRRPDTRQPWRLWYDIEPPSHIRFRHREERREDPPASLLREFRFEGSALILQTGDLVFNLTRPAEGSLPEWWPGILAEGLSPPSASRRRPW